MSTRCHIEFMDHNGKEVDVRLYHHSDGYPEFQLPKICRFLEKAHGMVTESPCYWWDSMRVAAIFIGWSMGDYEKPSLDLNKKTDFGSPDKRRANGSGWGVPVYQPCNTKVRYGDVEYVYQITLKSGKLFESGSQDCKADIAMFNTDGNGNPKRQIWLMHWPDDKIENVMEQLELGKFLEEED